MVNWYQFTSLANIVLALCLFAVAVLIGVPVVRHRLVRMKKLATAAAMLFFAIAVARGMVAVHYLVPGATRGQAPVTFWWEATWNLLTAAAAIYFLSLYRYYGQLFVGAPWFDEMAARKQAAAAGVEDSVSRVSAETERDRVSSMLRSIVANNQAAIFVKDLSGRYLLGNPRHAEIMGRPEADFLGLTDVNVNADLAEAWAANDERARRGLYVVEEYNDLFDDGRHFYESVRFPLYDKFGNVYAIAGSSLDVTLERRAKADVDRALEVAVAASAAKSTFLATMSHEIRTPMNAVIGMTDLLLDTDLDEQQHEFLDTIRLSGDALLSVINDILDFSKIESGEMRIETEAFDLREEVEGCLDLVSTVSTAKRIDVICYVEDSCPVNVVGDAPRLRQIVINLLSNAVKFTAVGEVLVTVSAAETADNRLLLTVTVTDTGIGISKEGLARLFESFSQVDDTTTRVYGGTGLGLVISQRLAQAMGGGISVTSVPEVGSTFVATLLLDPISDAVAEPTPAALVDLHGLSVLLVDDNLTCLRVLDLQLTSLGMACTPVSTPAEALSLVRGGLAYDVAVLDMLMPDMNGVQLATALRQTDHAKSAPIVLVTSVGSRPAGADGMFAALLAKPVKSAPLLRALSAALIGGPSVDPSERSHTFANPITPMRVLLAEDNPVNQRVAQLMLSKLGHSVHTVSTGMAAVAAITAKPYDVILMDIQMPELDGLEATRRIREQVPLKQQPYIIAMTASALVEDREACVAAGMESYLTKPVRALDLSNLLTKVAELIRPVRALPPRATPPSTFEQAGQPAIDAMVLDQLVCQLEDDTGEALAGLIDSYLVDCKPHISDLLVSGERNDPTAVSRIAHSIRSSSRLLGAVNLAELLQQAEDAARQGSPQLRPITSQVADEYARVSDALSKIRAEQSA